MLFSLMNVLCGMQRIQFHSHHDRNDAFQRGPERITYSVVFLFWRSIRCTSDKWYLIVIGKATWLKIEKYGGWAWGRVGSWAWKVRNETIFYRTQGNADFRGNPHIALRLNPAHKVVESISLNLSSTWSGGSSWTFEPQKYGYNNCTCF